MRDALARTLYELARQDERVCVVVADISPAGAMEDLRRDFPDRFINVGVAEQAMIGLAAGMAMRGLRPFCYTIATFALFRAYEFVRCDLAYQRLPVTVVGMGAGLSYPSLGGTHQAVEDVAVALACPGMSAVLAPCDPLEVAACARWCAAREEGGPVYLRLGKAGEPDLTGDLGTWEFGPLRWLLQDERDSRCILTYGPIAAEALEAARRLGGTSVVSATALRPLDEAAVEGLLEEYEEIYVVEEAAGAPLYLRVAAQAQEYMSGGGFGVGLPNIVRSFALPPDFGHYYGSRSDLLARAGLTAEAIVAQVRQP